MRVVPFLKFITAIVVITLGYLTAQIYGPRLFSYQSPLDFHNLSGLYSPDQKIGLYEDRLALAQYLPPRPPPVNVLGATSEEKRIEINLSNQTLYAFEGDQKIYEFPVSTGKWAPTPTGEFRIWIKLRYTKMSGGSKALNTYYYLPNVPFTMYFENAEIPGWRGYGIHGAYWHNNFGHPMSHGCVNMKTEDVEKIYYWATPVLGDKPSVRATTDNPGTRVIISGTTPQS